MENKEAWMSRIVLAGLAALFLSAPSLSHAQTSFAVNAREMLTEAASKAMIDRRIEVMKVTLGLNADQAKYWPAVEDAIHTRLTARHMRLVSLAQRHASERQASPIELVRERSDALAQKSAMLKKVADAWQPLYEHLDENQKQRLRFLAIYVAHELRDAVEARRMQAEDSDDEDDE
jgi:hypothetical protein